MSKKSKLISGIVITVAALAGIGVAVLQNPIIYTTLLPPTWTPTEPPAQPPPTATALHTPETDEIIVSPGESIQAAVDNAQPGDTILLRGGVYEEQWRIADISTKGTSTAKITMRSYPGETAILRTMQGWTLDILGASYWVFENITFERLDGWCAIRIGDRKGDITTTSTDLEFRNITVQNSPGGGICLQRGSHILVENSKFINLMRPGMDSHGVLMHIADNTIIRNNLFQDIGGDGVQVGLWHVSFNTTIENNTFVDTKPNDGAGENGVDVKQTGGTTIIRGNIFSGFRPCDVYCDGAPGEALVLHQGAQDVIIDSNEFYDNVFGIILSGDLRRVEITNNLFHDGVKVNSDWCSGGALAMYPNKTDAEYIKVYHNTIVNHPYHFCAATDAADGLEIRNNLVADSGKGISSGVGTFSNNGWFNVDDLSEYSGQDDVTGEDADFADDGYHLDANSPAIDKGADVAVTADRDGIARPQGQGSDLGAYEYAETVTPAPKE